MYHAQNRLDEFLEQRFFPTLRGGFFVECGAADGRSECTCLHFEEEKQWTGLNLEASPPLFRMLQANRPASLNRHVALSSTTGEAVFTHAVHPRHGQLFGNGSLSHTASHRAELEAEGCTFETYRVPTVRFADLAQELQLPPIDLFVLDVEGHELPALEGILALPPDRLPLVFCIEYPICGLELLNERLAATHQLACLHHHNALFVRPAPRR